MFVGVDGCKGGWVAVTVTGAGFRDACVQPTFAALMAEMGDAEVIAVDMPVGLLDEGARDADFAARRFLKGQTSCVFSTPPRPVLAAKSYDEARVISKRVSGKSLSRQAFSIIPKIPHNKKTWGGSRARLSLLKSAGIELPDALGDVDGVGMDDVIDAAAAAWSARRIAARSALAFPAGTSQRDRRGRLVVMWG